MDGTSREAGSSRAAGWGGAAWVLRQIAAASAAKSCKVDSADARPALKRALRDIASR